MIIIMCENQWLALYKVKAEITAYAATEIGTEIEIYVQ